VADRDPHNRDAKRMASLISCELLYLLTVLQVFRREAEALGVSGSRIHFTRGYSEEEHLVIKGAADVFLDTPSYNAHSTGTDALWAVLHFKPLLAAAVSLLTPALGHTYAHPARNKNGQQGSCWLVSRWCVAYRTLPPSLHDDVASVESPHLIARNEEDYLQARSSLTFTAARAVSDGSRSSWSLWAAGLTSCAESKIRSFLNHYSSTCDFEM
jgi:hypothetical protein